MDVILNDIEVRVLGSLIEKELTTPEYYPLSLNALVNACNQKSNRDPVMNLDESEVSKALDSLRFKQFALISGAGGRVAKFRHSLVEKFRFSPAELAIICELLVRGPQTVGELRTRCERMHAFADLSGVEAVLNDLMESTPPRVMKLPRLAGRKESRYCHLFSGEPDLAALESAAVRETGGRSGGDEERVARLEGEVAGLRQEVSALRQLLEDFRKTFE
ncbi:YceH family protein [Geomonas sp. Red32]|uniref:YceH family protein n=1 Tax=Geomonas sp. Red32 TaxID=2912856 RepID=UPI00202CE4C8|nr:YceH family protein [Geomonas sp. Red32]MCM0080905.1 YceH family protein [Geomonas sp. Red32]